MGEEINNPHDKGYKFILSTERVFHQLLQNFVSSGWVKKIDAESLTRIDKSYILQDFAGKEADLVYRLKIQEEEVIFYLLLELQSTVDFQMPFRLLQYMVEIWRDVLKNTPKGLAEQKDYRLPAIVPMVLYNGPSEWTACRQFKNALAGVEHFTDQGVNFQYILIDVNRYQKEALLELANLISAVFLFDQEMDQEELKKRLIASINTLTRLQSEDFQLFKTWFDNIASAHLTVTAKNEVIEIIEQARCGEVEQMVYNLERTFKQMQDEAIMQGKIEGKIEGKKEVVRNMLAKGMSEELITEVTGLSKEQIQEIRNQVH